MGDNTMDFRERCRLCIEPKRLSIDIFSEEGRRIKLKSKISKHLSVKVSQSDGLPRQICYQCLYRLETWVSFKQLCMERDQVMKTWSQSCMDETCEAEETLNGSKSYGTGEIDRDAVVTQPLRLRSTSRDVSSNKEAFAAGMQMDDAVSESSLWEVVKMDGGDNVQCERQDGNKAHNEVSSHNSPENYHLERDSSDHKCDWNRRKARKPSKASSSSSDSSHSTDNDPSCIDMSAQSIADLQKSSLSNQNSDKTSLSPQKLCFSGTSTPPLKRKRGRPSKASLQREREMKRIKDQEIISAFPISSSGHVVDNVVTSDIEKEEMKDDELIGTEFVPTIRSHIATPDFTPVVRDDGSGITEVVLDDPDFGSMKFTLSVVEVESPISSPIANEDYKYYPESCASSCGNLCSDSSNRDFEGFESPNNSAFMKSMLRDNSSLLSEEIPRSKSQADIRFSSCKDILPAGIKRKRSNSASGDFRVNGSAPGYYGEDDQEELQVDNIIGSVSLKMGCISKSFESLDECWREKSTHEALEERNAYSDGEISESPNKRLRRKSLLVHKSSSEGLNCLEN